MAITFLRSSRKSLSDGLPARRTGELSLKKIDLFRNLVRCYFDFVDVNRFDSVALVIPHAGPGLIKVKNRLVKDVPLVALDQRYWFDKFLFFEKDKELFRALSVRCRRSSKNGSVFAFPGEIGSFSGRLPFYLPKSSRGFRTKTLIYLDLKDFQISPSLVEQLEKSQADIILSIDPLDISNKRTAEYAAKHSETILSFCKDETVFSHSHNAEAFYRHVVRGFLFSMQRKGYFVEGVFRKDSGKLWYSGVLTSERNKRKLSDTLERVAINQYDLFA